jgi:hypothetical protein
VAGPISRISLFFRDRLRERERKGRRGHGARAAYFWLSVTSDTWG